MITLWKQENRKLVETDNREGRIWVDARNVTREDIRTLEADYGIDTEIIMDILDQDELSRIDREDDYTLMIVRLPIFISANEVSYFTIPLGILLFPEMIVTICWADCEVLNDLTNNRVRGLSLGDLPAFVVRVLTRADLIFLRYLKEINRRSNSIELELQKSVRNNELIQLLNLEKSLTYFTTSLKSNQLLFEKLMKTRLIQLDEEDRDWLEDVAIDNRQAIEMADIYSNILSGMMDAFASVISNNLSIVMKRLTVINLVLMIPTMITSFFGMNVRLPFSDMDMLISVPAILGICLLSSFLAMFLLRDKKPRRKDADAAERKRLRRKNRAVQV
ncbi:magnesium transporter CorA family protein [Treponema zuelzerae]|uniref:Magnesium transporter CorA family protein n=1 Tax=Teretinema zuelzerae TaxID=156 RepID=A0AAE3EHK9_9SPIR|nr:magnesium transporter CorA family protein [Teretinema zuelzerae]MBN2812149.1 magnesium transporter CorA family protein [Spirochaetales bacterium]MCD1653958.1 magnesium transporter CorA family protein [Teretinema zuelzerae]HPO03033.1 magnesium transporter CorA family protein [Treponemataceae bacterium]